MMYKLIPRSEGTVNPHQNKGGAEWSGETQSFLSEKIQADRARAELREEIGVWLIEERGESLGAIVPRLPNGKINWSQKVDYRSDRFGKNYRPKTLSQAGKIDKGQYVWVEDDIIIVSDVSPVTETAKSAMPTAEPEVRTLPKPEPALVGGGGLPVVTTVPEPNAVVPAEVPLTVDFSGDPEMEEAMAPTAKVAPDSVNYKPALSAGDPELGLSLPGPVPAPGDGKYPVNYTLESLQGLPKAEVIDVSVLPPLNSALETPETEGLSSVLAPLNGYGSGAPTPGARLGNIDNNDAAVDGGESLAKLAEIEPTESELKLLKDRLNLYCKNVPEDKKEEYCATFEELENFKPGLQLETALIRKAAERRKIPREPGNLAFSVIREELAADSSNLRALRRSMVEDEKSPYRAFKGKELASQLLVAVGADLPIKVEGFNPESVFGTRTLWFIAPAELSSLQKEFSGDFDGFLTALAALVLEKSSLSGLEGAPKKEVNYPGYNPAGNADAINRPIQGPGLVTPDSDKPLNVDGPPLPLSVDEWPELTETQQWDLMLIQQHLQQYLASLPEELSPDVRPKVKDLATDTRAIEIEAEFIRLRQAARNLPKQRNLDDGLYILQAHLDLESLDEITGLLNDGIGSADGLMDIIRENGEPDSGLDNKGGATLGDFVVGAKKLGTDVYEAGAKKVRDRVDEVKNLQSAAAKIGFEYDFEDLTLVPDWETGANLIRAEAARQQALLDEHETKTTDLESARSAHLSGSLVYKQFRVKSLASEIVGQVSGMALGYLHLYENFRDENFSNSVLGRIFLPKVEKFGFTEEDINKAYTKFRADLRQELEADTTDLKEALAEKHAGQEKRMSEVVERDYEKIITGWLPDYYHKNGHRFAYVLADMILKKNGLPPTGLTTEII